MQPKLYVTSNDGFFEEEFIGECAEYMPAAQQISASPDPLPNAHRGFGVAITGSSCYLLSKMNEEKRSALLEDVYGKDGLGLSVGRVSIASSDYSAEIYSYNDTPDDVEMKDFSVARDEAYVLPMIKEVLRHAPELQIYASPWSPPGWMKTGGSMCGGYMRAKYVGAMAKYMARFVCEYEKRGIHIIGLTPQNEPETQQNGRMTASMLHPDMEAELVLSLRRELDEMGLSPEIWMFDHNLDFADRVEWMLREYPELPKAVNGVAWHYYNGDITKAKSIMASFPDLVMHLTEGGPRLFENYGTDWCKWGGILARTVNGGFGSFTGWNLLLDQNGEPNVGPFYCAGLVTENTHTGELSYSGQYRALKHFSGLMRPGAKIYPVIAENTAKRGELTGNANSESGVVYCCAENPDGSRVIHAVNPGTDPVQAQIMLDGKRYYVRFKPDSLSSIVY